MDIISIIFIGALGWLLLIALIVIALMGSKPSMACLCESDYDEFNDCDQECCE